MYSSSEFGYPVSRLIIDQPYANTPIGYPTDGTELVLLDEKGLPSDEGECCIHLPFFRGYIGENSRCFVSWNGGKYFRSSDYVRRDEKGRYTVLSRMDDMVKINGNRVDTREVEAAVKNTLHVEFCCVRLILRNGIKFPTAYYTADREIDNVQAAGALRECISEYMIPSVFIRLETIPVNANGKVDKRALPEPDQALRAMPYSAPEDPVQEQLCKTYQRVLTLNEGVGIDDDFFTLGGDSLGAMEVLSSCDIPGLSVQMIYKGRTVRKITELLNEAGKKEKAEEEALTVAPLNIGQLYLLRSDLMYPGTCMLNLAVRLNILPTVDMKRLAGAIRRTIKAHPALLSTIVEKNDSYFLAYRPEFDREIPVEKMTDDALEQEAERFVHPFRLDGTPLVRCRVTQAEKKRAVFLDVYHVLCDGISLNKLISDFGTSYAGGEIAPDPCYSQLREEESYRTSEQFQKDMDYFAELCDRPGWDTLPRLDHDINENTDDTIFKAFPFSSEEADRLVKKYGFGKNGLYIAATALSIAAYNESENIMFTWTWHDRSNRKRADSVVLFTEQRSHMFRKHHRARRLIDSGRFKLRRHIRQEGFDAVICTHVFAAMMLTAAREGGALPVRTALVETDYTNTPGAAASDLDLYFVPDPSLMAGLVKAGVPRERIVPSGIPIRQAMLTSLDRTEAMKRLGLDPAHKHILLMGGSMGCGPLEDLADMLYLFLADDVEVTVVCGTNDALLGRLQDQLGHAENFHLLGYAQQMSLLMDSAALLVTKPGGITVTEAATKGLPLVLMDTVAGCEAHNRRFFVERGGAVSANSPEEAFRLCEKLLQDEANRRSMRQTLIAMSRPDAAETIYESMLRLIP